MLPLGGAGSHRGDEPVHHRCGHGCANILGIDLGLDQRARDEPAVTYTGTCWPFTAILTVPVSVATTLAGLPADPGVILIDADSIVAPAGNEAAISKTTSQ